MCNDNNLEDGAILFMILRLVDFNPGDYRATGLDVVILKEERGSRG